MSNLHTSQINEELETSIRKKEIFQKSIGFLYKGKLIPLFLLTLVLVAFYSLSLMAVPIYIKNIVDSIQEDFNVNTIIPLIIILCSGALAGFLVTISSTYLVQKIVLMIRQRVVQHSLTQSMSYYTKEPLGRMVTRITKDLDETANFYQIIFSQVGDSIISFFSTLVILYLLSKYLLLYSLIGVPFIIAFAEFYRRNILKKSKLVRAQTSYNNIYLSEHLQAFEDLQVHNKVSESINLFHAYNLDLYRKDRSLGLNQTLVHPILNLILVIITASICLGGILILESRLALTVGTFIAFIQLIQRFFFPLMNLAQATTQIQTSVVSLERIFSFLKIDTSLPEAASSPKNTRTYSTLEFSKVSFSYTPNNPVLSNISFSLAPGKKTAIVGHSGSGKSTIAKLCMRFWDIQEGSILLNGVPIQLYPGKELRQKIVLLEQDSYIFKDSVRENILLGRNISQSKLDEISEKTGISKLVSSYKDGWEHIINTKEISTGEQRLIAIARVLIEPPEIIILDEFSATLDNTTEHTIQTLIQSLQLNRATIIIAHRLKTIKQCDEIIYLNEGKIEEQGTHEELLALGKGYARLIKNMNEINLEQTEIH